MTRPRTTALGFPPNGPLCVPLVLLVFSSLAMPLAAESPDSRDVRAHGATGDGLADDTAAVQGAIDACAAAGGTVVFPPGAYRCGTLYLRSRVHLFLDHGATLLGSDNPEDYAPFEKIDFRNDADPETSFFQRSLLFGDGIERVAITGSGTIDANHVKRGGPKPIALKRCAFVEIRGIRILNAPNYAISLLGTDNVNIDGVTILNAFADGIDPDSCRNVRVSNCHIESVDDAIVPKASFSLGERRACENIVVTNCVLSTVCNGFKLGTESGGGFRRIAVSNCVITGFKDHRPAISGIALESVDGGDLDGIVVSNIVMDRVRAPVFIRLGNRGRDMGEPVPGTLRNVSVSNVVATRASLACSITGLPYARVQGVTLSDIRIHFIGGNPRQPDNEPVLELARVYPEAAMFGAMPAYGLYCRHVDDLALRNVVLDYADDFWRLTTDVYRDITWPENGGMPSHAEPAEAGHALFCEDVRHLRIDGFRARPSRDGAPAVYLTEVLDVSMDAAATEQASGNVRAE
ncbi:MAG: right-handed parallel beta-helix repeat-containing protein [Candidatus Hydrogenedentes bacterium]|nr:right-handed parallel beta-helix repeat-containing protein [Candidatus Hydrogenedentota bacterium]